MENELEKTQELKNIIPVLSWLNEFNVVKTVPSNRDVVELKTTFLDKLLPCYNELMDCVSKNREIYGEILAHLIPLKYIYDPDWISLFQGGDTLFFRLRRKDNTIIEDLDDLRKILKSCDVSEKVYFNTLGVYYRDGRFCCLYFRYHETLRQRTKVFRSYNNHKITLLYLN